MLRHLTSQWRRLRRREPVIPLPDYFYSATAMPLPSSILEETLLANLARYSFDPNAVIAPTSAAEEMIHINVNSIALQEAMESVSRGISDIISRYVSPTVTTMVMDEFTLHSVIEEIDGWRLVFAGWITLPVPLYRIHAAAPAAMEEAPQSCSVELTVSRTSFQQDRFILELQMGQTITRQELATLIRTTGARVTYSNCSALDFGLFTARFSSGTRWEPTPSKAHVRSKDLLKRWLSSAQLEQFEKTETFEVVGSVTGKTYTIKAYRNFNISDGERDYCLHPEGCDTLGDIMLAQKISFETDEATAVNAANVADRRNRLMHFDFEARPS